MTEIHTSVTPRDQGFWMPAEFEEHCGCWMAWPERPDVWRENAEPAQRAFAEVACAIVRFEPVTVCVSREQWRNARALLPGTVRVVELTTDDAWMRDTAPQFVVDANGEVRGVDWNFNAYGGPSDGCYWPCGNDILVARKILELEGLRRYPVDMVLEGGSVHVDGQGTLLTTEECLLNPNRNPTLTRHEIEHNLREYLGVEKVIWLHTGVVGDDDNDGHVDDLCCFARPGLVMLNWTDDRDDPQYARSQDALDTLRSERDARGRELEVVKLHQPEATFFTELEVAGIRRSRSASIRNAGDRIGASYVNFYLPNGAVVVPGFGSEYDACAVDVLRRVFPERRVVQLQTREILLGVGNVHCIVMQQPRAHRK